MNTDTTVVSFLTDLCESNPEVHKYMSDFEASLEQNSDINAEMSQHYNPLIRRAESVSAARAETQCADKKKSATDVRNTLIKSMVFACMGFDYLQAKLMIPQAESNAMNPPGTLSPAQILETLGVLPTENKPKEKGGNDVGDEPAPGAQTVQDPSTGCDLEEPVDHEHKHQWDMDTNQ
ncbi:uncharacterized protein LOC111066934 [Drosophila obscura]|uniref:uncharacterized protein LOC111066934 n=1 Tax=Drosophila obscura TaxID=7282 RepID=UPI001BB19E2D|nr:uncharacterized protein LOC111066934 [Drosophila obscura]